MKISRWTILVFAMLNGLWMLADGITVLTTGHYLGPAKPGPWAELVATLGIDPFALGPVFILSGAWWLTTATGLFLKAPWGWWCAVLCAMGTLWYFPVGSGLSIVVLILLLVDRSQRAPRPKGPI